VLSPDLHDLLQDRALAYLWSDPGRRVLLEVPVEVDPDTKGWSVRVR